MPDFAPLMESWTYRSDGRWDVVESRGGVELKRSVQDGVDPVDLFREAQQEIAAKALKRLKARNR